MKKVVIKNGKIENFKGWHSLSIDFNQEKTEFYGRSETGKSSVYLAFLWACGLNVEKPYPVYTEKTNNNLIEKFVADLKTDVSFALDVDGLEYTIQRTAVQTFKTDRETGEKEYNGHKADTYHFDGLPCNARDFKEKLTNAFGLSNYNLLPQLQISNYFNSNTSGWDWKNRRALLFDLANVDNLVKEIKGKEDYKLIYSDIEKVNVNDLSLLTRKYNTEKREIESDKNRVLDEIRIHTETLAEFGKYDFVELERLEKAINKDINSAKEAIAERDKHSEIAKIRHEIALLNKELAELKTADLDTLGVLKRAFNESKTVKDSKSYDLSRLKENIGKKKTYLKELEGTEWNGEKACPTCKREYDYGIIESAQTEFEKSKKERVANLNIEIADISKELLERQEEYAELVFVSERKERAISDFKENPKIKQLQLNIENKNNEVEMLQKNNSVATDTVLTDFENELAKVKEQLAMKKVQEHTQKKIQETKAKQEAIRNAEAQNAVKRHQLENLTLEIIEKSNNSVNELFDGVEFRLFDTLTANAEKDIKPACEIVMDGTPYSAMSTGQKIQADFKCLIGLQKISNVNLPIFIDEAESSTYERTAEQQLILLRTVNGDTNLNGTRIKNII